MSVQQYTVPIIVVGIFIIIVAPIPAAIIDMLVCVDLTISLMLLLSTLFTSSLLSLSSFPTIILITTIFRLALNISTTRVILEKGIVGEVVSLFGNAITANSIGIGMVIFIIISIVQLIVISKGSERIAEVSARFALDAMPVRQMAIDSELRSGLLSIEEARKKRKLLQEESMFFGSLDGSMKFIKGDAIAGFLVTFVNLLGGVIVGVSSFNLDIYQAISKYCILSIGDGVVSQIPSLMCAIAAGILVTKVTLSENHTISETLPKQILGNVKVRAIVGFMSILICLVTTVPKTSFLIFGSLLLVSVVFMKSKTPEIYAECGKSKIEIPSVCSILLSSNFFKSSDNLKNFYIGIEKKRKDIFERTGVLIPLPMLDSVESAIDDLSLAIRLRGIVLHSLQYNIDDIKPEELGEKALEVYINNLPEIIDDNFTQILISQYEKLIPILVSNTIPNIISVTEFSMILKLLVDESVSIRQVDVILQTVSEYAQDLGKGRELIREIRRALARTITNQYINEDGVLKVLRVDSYFEEACIEANSQNIILDSDLVRSFNLATEKYVNYLNKYTLVVAREARELVRDYLKASGLKVPVLSYDEISTDKVEIVKILAILDDSHSGSIKKVA